MAVSTERPDGTGGERKRIVLYGRSLQLTGDPGDETYRHLPVDVDVVDPMLRAFPGQVAADSVCIDAGAGFGLHTLALGILAPRGRVLALEPASVAFDHLQCNVADNDATNVTARRMCPAPGAAAALPLEPEVARLVSTRHPPVADAPPATIDQLVDELSLARVGVVRVSLSGAELTVLDGARRTLDECRPSVFVVFNSFEIAVRQTTLPHVALARLRDMFPYCHVLDRADGSAAALNTDDETFRFLYDNTVNGPVDHLLCTFEPLAVPGYVGRPALGSAGELATVVSQRDEARDRAMALERENEALGRRNAALAGERDRATAELEAMRRTVSWRVTSPLRQVRARTARATPAPSTTGPRAGEEGSDPPVAVSTLPTPPFEMRQLVGPTDEAAFDNPSGDLVFPELPAESYEAVFDFGCGCGRLARRLIQQRPPPRRYVGIDVHRGMVTWCRANLAPAAPGFLFLHHDVLNPSLNPGPEKPLVAPFPVDDASFSLVVAFSVFTHLTQPQVPHYLAEVARVLRPGGVALTTWFLFDKTGFPMMQDFQHALYINLDDPTNAVIFDREWVRATVAGAGLTITRADPPAIRGYQWQLWLALAGDGARPAELPRDDAPVGSMPPPLMPDRATSIGLEQDGADAG